MTEILLVAHGSRHPQARATVEQLAASIRRRLPARIVSICALDLDPPTPRAALLQLARHGARQVQVVPRLFAPGHHIRVDLPRQIAAAGTAAGWAPTDREPVFATVAGPLIDCLDRAPNELLLDALDARAGRALGPVDALVLLAAGSSDDAARAAVASVARAWGHRHGVPAQAAFASGPGPGPAEAVTALRAAGAARVLAGSLFVAPGVLPMRAEQSASRAGAIVSPATPSLVELVTLRAVAATA